MKTILAATMVILQCLALPAAARGDATASCHPSTPAVNDASVDPLDATQRAFAGKRSPIRQLESGIPPETTGGGENFGAATVIAALPYSDSGTTAGFLNDYDPPCARTGAPDVVYRYTPAENTCVTISLCGSTYDTALIVYEDTPANPIACNDDYCASGLMQSKLVSVPLIAGHNYYIVVDGYECVFLGNCSEGPYTLSVTTDCPPACAVTCPPGAIDEGEPVACNLDGTNDGCNLAVPGFTDIPCSAETVTVCGRFGSRDDAQVRDTDWYRFILTDPRHVSFCISAEATSILQILEMPSGCTGWQTLLSTATEPCQEACLEANLGAGTYAVAVASIFATNIPCGTPYTLKASCEPFPLHCNDINGNSSVAGKTFVMRGVVTGSYPVSGTQRFYLQDTSTGVVGFGVASVVPSLGDSLRVSGNIIQFNGLVEISSPLSITWISGGHPQPQPVVLTPSQVNGSFHLDSCEPDESSLVRIERVTIVSSTGAPLPPGTVFAANTNYGLLADDASLATMRIVQSSNIFGVVNPLVGTAIPAGFVNVTGVLTQFDSSVPYTSAYQVYPRLTTDIVPWVPSDVESGVRRTLALRPPYPNPTHGAIAFGLELRDPGVVDAAVYDVAGRRIATVATRAFGSGVHVLHWDGFDDTRATVPSGVYYMQVRAGSRTVSREFVVAK